MRYLTLVLCLLIQLSASATEINLYRRYNPSSQVIDGLSFPRNDQLLYRGLRPVQMNYEKAVRAMLGDKKSNLESPLLFAVKEQLKGNQPDILTNVAHVLSEYTTLGLSIPVASAQVEKDHYSEPEAFAKANEIITTAMNRLYTDGDFANAYLNYASVGRNDWPASLIYSSLHVDVAKIYSSSIVVFKDGAQRTPKRSLDLNYWNKVQNGMWIGTNREFPDKGEFLSPLYIPYNHIVGYQLRHTAPPDVWYMWQDLQNDMHTAFYKATVEGKDYVLIIDGSQGDSFAQTIIEEDGTYYYARSTFDSFAVHPTYPVKAGRQPVRLKGIIEVCEEECSADIKKLFPQYKFSDNELGAAYFARLQRNKVNGKKVRVHTEKTIEELKVENKYEDLIDLNSLQVTRKLISEYDKKAKIINSCSATGNTLTCQLNDRKLAQDKVLYIPVPESLRTLKVEKVDIEQRQEPSEQSEDDKEGWDDTPAYLSVQFFVPNKRNLDQWRYYAARTSARVPKGSIFSEVRDLSDNEPQTLDFDDEPHAGTILGIRSRKALRPYAIRVINTGSDNTYINNLTVSFK